MTRDEARAAYRHGLARHAIAWRRGWEDRHGYRPSLHRDRYTHGWSAVSEALVAEVTGRRWISRVGVPDDSRAGDVEGGIAVRWTPRQRGCLIVRPDDWSGLLAVLVVGNSYPLRVVGWLPVTECQRDRWWRTRLANRPPAWFVPQAALYPVAELVAMCREVEAR